MWFNLAASRLTSDLDAGVDTSVADDLSEARERAVQGRDVAEGRMTPDGLNEAERRAREWDAPHPREP